MSHSARVKPKFSISLEKFRQLSKGKIFACIAIIAFMVMMLAKPDFYLNSARRGLTLFATSVLPSLFPFYFFSLLLTYIGAAKTVSTIFKNPVRLLYNAPKESAYVLILSMLSGYPIGASMTAELYSAGAITQKEAKSIAAFASTSGPIFMLGTVGSAIFNDVRVGVVVLISHYLAALINGLIYRVRKTDKSRRSRKSSNTETPPDIRIMSNQDYDSLMSKTIANSTLSMLYVGGYIVICGMLTDTVALLGVNNLLSTVFGEQVSQVLIALIYGLIEMTRGSIACAECELYKLGIALCAGIISLGGLSVTLQNYTFLSKCNMRFIDVAVRKLTQSIIAFALAYGFSFIL
ncbi:MAG: hypothetical protein K2J16_01375 [Clostridia bacterium]|nr:hypothetical protein [Clostridia bacterium]